MQDETHWKTRYQREIEQAQAARLNGNEGMARVCARRAAGAAISEYLRRQGLPDQGPSAYDRLRYLVSMPDSSPEIKARAANLLRRVNPDHNLPIDVDLIAEARWLKGALLDAPPSDEGSKSNLDVL